MRVTLIGSGNVATVLGRRLYKNAHIIHQVAGRNGQHAEQLASTLSATAVSLAEIDKEADIFIICVSDKSIDEVAGMLHLGDKLVVHTAGSIKMDVLKNASTNYGVVYPLQSLRKELEYEPVLPILVDGNSPWNRTKLFAFAQSFADKVSYADDEQRSVLHLGAIFVNNFTNYLFTLAEQYCKDEGVEFSELLPLIEETVKRLQFTSPSDVQTGPAIRNDTATISRHLELLKDHPGMREVYGELTGKIMGSAKSQK